MPTLFECVKCGCVFKDGNQESPTSDMNPGCPNCYHDDWNELDDCPKCGCLAELKAKDAEIKSLRLALKEKDRVIRSLNGLGEPGDAVCAYCDDYGHWIVPGDTQLMRLCTKHNVEYVENEGVVNAEG